MTAPQPTPRLTDRKRDAIVQAAIGEFREHGFNGTSMDRVAAAADVSKRTVYNHFPSKEELFEAILLLMWERSQSPDDLAYTPARPLRDQLLELLAQKMRLLNDASFIDLSRVAMADMMHTPERARSITAKLSAKEEGLPRWLRLMASQLSTTCWALSARAEPKMCVCRSIILRAVRTVWQMPFSFRRRMMNGSKRVRAIFFGRPHCGKRSSGPTTITERPE